jgi:hypothetical protein
MSDKTIYDLELFERYEIDDSTHMTRVPGGWIYFRWHNARDHVTETFVPYNVEFQVVDVPFGPARRGV